MCTFGGPRYGCGGRATRALSTLIAEKPVTCVKKGSDVYGRTLGVCRSDSIDLSSAMVRQGWALAYLKYALDYVSDERAAEATGAGAWAGTFEQPWTFREGRSTGAAEAQRVSVAPSPNCIIKGNVNAKGDRIYHLPGSRDYTRTKPENWFCTETEAVAAGFRRALTH